MSTISCLTMETGCLEPSSSGSAGMVRSSFGPCSDSSAPAAFLSSSIFAWAACFSSLSARPNSFLKSLSIERNSSNRAVTSPFLPRKRTLASSTSFWLLHLSSLSSASTFSISSLIIITSFWQLSCPLPSCPWRLRTSHTWPTGSRRTRL